MLPVIRNAPGGKGGRCVRLTTYHHYSAVVTKTRNLNYPGPLRAYMACWDDFTLPSKPRCKCLSSDFSLSDFLKKTVHASALQIKCLLYAWATAVLNTPEQCRFWRARTEGYRLLQAFILQKVPDLICCLYFAKSKLHFTLLTLFSLSFRQAKKVRLTSHTGRIVLKVRNLNK